MTNQFELEQKREYTRIVNGRDILNFNSLEYQRKDIYTCTSYVRNGQADSLKKSINDTLLEEIETYCTDNYPDSNTLCYLSDVRELGSYSDRAEAVIYTLVAEIKIYLGHGVQ